MNSESGKRYLTAVEDAVNPLQTNRLTDASLIRMVIPHTWLLGDKREIRGVSSLGSKCCLIPMVHDTLLFAATLLHLWPRVY